MQWGSELGRRIFLGTLGAGAAMTVTGMSRAEASPVPTRTVPRTLAASGTGRIIRPGFLIEHVSIRWRAGESCGRIRFAGPTGRFGDWQPIRAGCAAGRGEYPVDAGSSALVAADRASACELDLPAGAVAVALNCTDGPPIGRGPLGSDQAELAGCAYLSRAAWGADESLRFDESGAERYPETYWPLQTITVHHTATVNDDPDPAARVRAIYRTQTIDQDFGDIGYHFLIDEAGRIYEGRWSGTDGVPGFNRTGLMVNAAHVLGFNAGNVGVALLGTFTDQPPTRPAHRSLTILLALIVGWRGIDPLATMNYLNPISGAAATVPAISGHRDWAATLCPGDLLAQDLSVIRLNVADMVDTRTISLME